MYKEKVVASFIVAVLCKQTLKTDEMDVLRELCKRDFNSNNKFVSGVKDMIRDEEDISTEEFAKSVYEYMLSEIIDGDEEIKSAFSDAATLRNIVDASMAIKDAEDSIRTAEQAIEKLEQDAVNRVVGTDHVIVHSNLGGKVFVTEYESGVLLNEALMSPEKFEDFKRFVEKRGVARIVSA